MMVDLVMILMFLYLYRFDKYMKGRVKTESKEVEVRRKLEQSGIKKPEEFEEIISNLISQRERLEGDLKVLREKVVALQQKQARKEIRPHRKDPRTTHIVLNQREELTRKYEQLKQWQKRSSKAMKNTVGDSQYRGYLDKLFSIQQEIQGQLKKYNDQKATYTKLKKALKVIDREDEKNSNVQEGIERENLLLKKRIGSLKKIVDRQMVKEIELQTCLIDMREKERTAHEREGALRKEGSRLRQRSRTQSRHREPEPRHKTEAIHAVTASDVSSQQLQEEVSLDFFPGQMTTKDDILQMQGYLNRLSAKYFSNMSRLEKKIKEGYPYKTLSQFRPGSKLTYAKEFELTLEHCKTNLSLFDSLNKQKVSFLLQRIQNNQTSSIYHKEIGYTSTSLAKGGSDIQEYDISRSARKLRSIVCEEKVWKAEGGKGQQKGEGGKGNTLQEKWEEKIMFPRVFEEREMQTDISEYCDPHPLRREFVGILSETRVDDRHLLGSEKNSSIKTLHIYYTDRGIASIRAVYTLNPSTQTLQGKISLPDPFISNYCKVHTISTSHEDFIRYFKLRYNFLENRITSLKIVTNRGAKNGWGDHKIKSEERELDEQVQRDYVFDVNKDEFPVCIVVSHVQKGPYWYLCGFGVEVNQL